jgi:anti-sigma-K factor RskA/putative zinc finger protein
MTAACNECRTLLGGYVLHALEPDEDETVRRHLAECAACAAEHGQLMSIPSILDTAGADETPVENPPAALEEAVLDRFAREHPGHPSEGPPTGARTRGRIRAAFRPLTRPLPAAIAGAVAAAAVTAALIALPGGGSSDGELYQARLAGSPAAPGATASAQLKVLEEGTRVNLSVRGLHGNPSSVYELWCIRDDGQKVSAGTFRTDASGRANVNLTTAAVPGDYHRLGVERKPGVNVMAGEIQFPHS